MKHESDGDSLVARALSLASYVRFPRSRFPHVSLARPYWSGATYRSSFDCWMRGKVIDGPELDKLKASVSKALGVEHAILCGSGSLGLEIVLRALGVQPGDEVVIPTFCCTAVVPPILAVGAVPVLADVGAELNVCAATVEAVLGPRTSAIIVPHLFGNPAEMGPIMGLARGRNIHVIDDAAQALGAAIDGQPVGVFGDAGVVSFGREKICFGLGGGAVLFQNKELAISAANDPLQPPARMTALGNLLSMLVWHGWRRWLQPPRSSLSFSARHGPDAPPVPYRKEKMSNLNAAVAFSLMQTLQENINLRRARVRAYQELLEGGERVQLIAHRNESACLTQVVRVLPRRRNDDPAARVVEALAGAGYEIQGSYVPIHLLPGYERCRWRRLSYAEKVWGDLIELPCEPQVRLTHVERIAAIIKRSLRR